MTVDVNDKASVAAFARAERLVVVATVSPEGAPEAALVDIAADDDGTFFFTAKHTTRKIANLEALPQAAMVIGTTGNVSLQLEGDAYVATGEERATLAEAYLAHYPSGRVEAPDFDVVVLRPTWVRMYDMTNRPPAVTVAEW